MPNAVDPTGLEEKKTNQPSFGSIAFGADVDSRYLIDLGRALENGSVNALQTQSHTSLQYALIQHGRRLERDSRRGSPQLQFGYYDEFGWHRTFCMSCHDSTNQNSVLKFQVAKNTLDCSWSVFLARDFAPAIVPLSAAGLSDDLVRSSARLTARTQSLVRSGDVVQETSSVAVRRIGGTIDELSTGGNTVARGRVLNTGARQLRDPTTMSLREAEATYQWIRGLDAETNIVTVARNTEMPQQVIRSIRQHIFFEEHLMLDGTTSRFVADEGIATWWKMATQGRIPTAELERVQGLFSHEYIERSLMRSGIPYRLHESGFPRGAHELAPAVPNLLPGRPLYRPGIGPWSHLEQVCPE